MMSPPKRGLPRTFNAECAEILYYSLLCELSDLRVEGFCSALAERSAGFALKSAFYGGWSGNVQSSTSGAHTFCWGTSRTVCQASGPPPATKKGKKANCWESQNNDRTQRRKDSMGSLAVVDVQGQDNRRAGVPGEIAGAGQDAALAIRQVGRIPVMQCPGGF